MNNNSLSVTLDSVIELKRKAKNRTEASRYEKAIELISNAIKILTTDIDINSLPPADILSIYSELADCYGIQGGIYRRWSISLNNTLDEKSLCMRDSYLSYEKGAEIEEMIGKEIPNSYNSLNKIISHILYSPTLLSSPSNDSYEYKKIKFDLEKLKDKVEKQVSTPDRSNDMWAWADLGLINLLLLEDKRPELLFAGFIGVSPTDKAINSLLSTLEPLSKIDTHAKESIQMAIDYLKKYRLSS
jgi:tetratricopeptide (TPR) repeat protein